MTNHENLAAVSLRNASPSYEAPTLTVIADACSVIQGMPGVGYDGPCGMTEPEFEFEPDGEFLA